MGENRVLLLNLAKVFNIARSYRKIKHSFDRKYTQLLIALILNFMLASFLVGNVGNIILSFFFVNTMITIVRTFSIRPRIFRLYNLIALSVFVIEIIGILGFIDATQLYISVLVQFIYAIYLSVGVYLIFGDIANSKKVTMDTIMGAICIYFLLGLCWAFLYSLCGTFDPDAFSIDYPISFNTFVYFSFTTLTTVGYGDISPTTEITRMLTNLEAIVGQMYPAIIISILVSIYTAQRQK